MKHEIPSIKYTKLSEMTESGEYNCYGIIYDASFPQIQEQSQQGASKYECTIKLIDENINFLNCFDVSTFNNNIITLIIKSQYKEKIPYIHTIGDIIRIHSGIYSHKNKKNIYLQIAANLKGQTNASWCIFSGLTPPDDDNKNLLPILSSRRYYSFDSQDKIIIKELRNFIKNKLSLTKSICFPMETALDKRIINKENDTTVKVNYKNELDDKYIYFVQDDTDICELQTTKYFDFIHVGDIIRIRSYRFTEKNILSTNQFSNILIIPKTLGYYKEFLDKIKEQKIKNDKDKKNKKNSSNNDLNSIENNNLSEPLINLIYQKINDALNFNKYLLDLVPTKFSLKQMNLIKNCLIEKEKNSKMNNRTEPFIKKNDSFIDNSSQFENFISEIKPSYEDIKETDILNITQ